MKIQIIETKTNCDQKKLLRVLCTALLQARGLYTCQYLVGVEEWKVGNSRQQSRTAGEQWFIDARVHRVR